MREQVCLPPPDCKSWWMPGVSGIAREFRPDIALPSSRGAKAARYDKPLVVS